MTASAPGRSVSVGHDRDRRRAATTVKINVHMTADGSTAVGVIRSEWQGATRTDFRIKGLERRPVPVAPEGVDPAIWAARCTLEAMCRHQEAAAQKATAP